MGACQSGFYFEMPGIAGQELLDDDLFLEALLDLETRLRNFNSVALYTREEHKRDVYNIKNDTWKKVKYFEKHGNSSAGLICKCNNGEWLLLELNPKGFLWIHKGKFDSKRINGVVDRIHISETHRHDVPIDFIRRLIGEQKDRCYEKASLFNFSEFATTMFKQILKRHQHEENQKLNATRSASKLLQAEKDKKEGKEQIIVQKPMRGKCAKDVRKMPLHQKMRENEMLGGSPNRN